jgi:Cu-Zn family superoxide dismutase
MKFRMSMLMVGALALSVYVVNAQVTQPKTTKTTTIQKAKAADHAHSEEQLPTKAVCVLKASKGSEVEGSFMLTQQGNNTEIIGEVKGLEPGKHGFHIHEFGDLRSDDGMAAGGHYNPEGHKHGGPDSAERHVGDLGNITANADGIATVKMMVRGLKVHFVIGRSLVVHAKEDDLKSDPSGNAGGRIGVGVIGISNDKPPGSTTTAPTSKGDKKTKS